jgi:hypothetical protein
MPRQLIAGPMAAALASLVVVAPAGALNVPFGAPPTSGKVVTCSNDHGLKVSGRLPVHWTVQSIKGGHPTSTALSCNQAYAVVKAGLSFLGANAAKSLGKTKRVNGVTYTFDQRPIARGASGPTYAWAGDSTVIDLQISTGA